MKKLVITLIVIAVIGGSAWGYYKLRGGEEEIKWSTLAVTRGEIIESVGPSGTLEAVTQVQVGTQVSGIVQDLYADFNSIVKKGQIIARIDPSVIQAQIEQSKANLVRTKADLERQGVATEDARVKLRRTESLAKRNLVSAQELEAANVAVRSAEAQLKSSEAALTQSEASLAQQEVNLQHTVIEAPIDGIVISRNVDRGQTVAASMNAPTLFIIAEDLRKMRLNANVDESDVGRIRPGQHVRFRVDAYPTEEFVGTVAQVRLQPVTVQNVVTYATVIDVPNPNLKLKPGMTATITIEIAKRENVLRVPNAALRFRPTADTFAALKQPVPPELQRMAGGGNGRGGLGGRAAAGDAAGGGREGAARPAPSQAAAPAPGAGRPAESTPAAGAVSERPQQSARSAADQPQSGEPGRGVRGSDGGGRGGFGMGQGGGADAERQQRMAERLKNMSPEERAQWEERMRARGGGAAAFGGGGRGDRQNVPPAAPRPQSTQPSASGAFTTIDQLFGPLVMTESRGRVWLRTGDQLKSVAVRLGITDGTYTELISGDIQAGQELVTSITTPAQAAASTAGRSPLMPGGPGRGPGGMPGGGGGRGR
ncbi:MAG: efflux RND transporter periplasmic adaptor subunit [Acidobacteriota bacterium]